MNGTRYIATVAAIVALGGFLMGFDASVISGVVGSIEREFTLSKLQVGWSVASLSLTATLAMMIAGPLSDRLGRRPVLMIAASLFLVSAIASALAPSYLLLVAARMLGGLGVGAALIIAPMYIAEIAPAAIRGRMVSFNQLNIVIGISAAFFSNYLILRLGQSDLSWAASLALGEAGWRWMLGVEALPALLYLLSLLAVPESPRWLIMNGREDEARGILERTSDPTQAAEAIEAIHAGSSDTGLGQGGQAAAPASARLKKLFSPAMRLVLGIGLVVAVLQQITGINAVFFYAPMIFEQSGIGTDAAFLQAVLVGLTNLLFTVVAMLLIDRLGRRLLLLVGISGVAIAMFSLAYGFDAARYTIEASDLPSLAQRIDVAALEPLVGRTFESDLAFRAALREALGIEALREAEPELVSVAITMNPTLILVAILAFVASFAVSLGPVMWVLFSELFPYALRGLAISFVGLVNSAVSFTIQLVFPWELATLGNAMTFGLYGAFAVIGLIAVARLLPETRGLSLEEIERKLVVERA